MESYMLDDFSNIPIRYVPRNRLVASFVDVSFDDVDDYDDVGDSHFDYASKSLID